MRLRLTALILIPLLTTACFPQYTHQRLQHMRGQLRTQGTKISDNLFQVQPIRGGAILSIDLLKTVPVLKQAFREDGAGITWALTKDILIRLGAAVAVGYGIDYAIDEIDGSKKRDKKQSTQRESNACSAGSSGKSCAEFKNRTSDATQASNTDEGGPASNVRVITGDDSTVTVIINSPPPE